VAVVVVVVVVVADPVSVSITLLESVTKVASVTLLGTESVVGIASVLASVGEMGFVLPSGTWLASWLGGLAWASLVVLAGPEVEVQAPLVNPMTQKYNSVLGRRKQNRLFIDESSSH
jgi:hypothetical protein